MRRRKRSSAERAFVELRAGRNCEYCKSPMDFTAEIFHIEHIIPLSKGGSNELSNLALSCSGCNMRKSHRVSNLYQHGNEFPFFNPRIDTWTDHFVWSDDFALIIPVTKIGEVTLDALTMNRNSIINLRKALVRYDVFPPK